MVDGLTQVAVVKPESGNWSVLTRDRSHGPAVDIGWSPDGTLIYCDRVTDVPDGKVIIVKTGLRASLWKFQPALR